MKKEGANAAHRSGGACRQSFPKTSCRFVEISRKVITDYIRMVSRVSCSWEYFGVVDDVTKRVSGKVHPKSKDRVLMIMESPHVMEYKYTLRQVSVVGLAQQCGNRISTHFSRLFQGLNGFDLFLVNAIPFQCSIGTGRLLNCLVKNKIFKRLLDDNDVLNELEAAITTWRDGNCNGMTGRCVIVNACGKVDKCNRIEGVVKKIVDTEDYWRAPHPCTWTKTTQSQKGFKMKPKGSVEVKSNDLVITEMTANG